MPQRLVFIPILLVLATCGTIASKMTTPDGGSGYFVRCQSTKAECFEKAITTCPTGYRIIDSENISPTRDTSPFFEMLIQCDYSWQNMERTLKK
ncbi:MAG: hypothetical protein HQM14_11520 [SAR324 cluster bacterium]|nr:hypothetical protein [SAR324 cluster bacterium]